VLMKNFIFQDTIPHSLLKVNRCMEGTCRLHLKGSVCHLLHAGFLLGLFFDPEDRGNMFFKTSVYFQETMLGDGILQLNIRSTVNNFMDCPHSGAVMHYSGYVEPRDGALSFLPSSQQEAVVCMWGIQKESHCCDG
jgi:hypothetical protein